MTNEYKVNDVIIWNEVDNKIHTVVKILNVSEKHYTYKFIFHDYFSTMGTHTYYITNVDNNTRLITEEAKIELL